MKYLAAVFLLFALAGCNNDVKVPVEDIPQPSYTPFTHAPTLEH